MLKKHGNINNIVFISMESKMSKYGEHIKVWKSNFGIIPKDKNGRSYEIHHMDGNPDNNHPNNLMCISIDEHFNIHKEQGDWNAAFLIARRMEIKPKDLSEIAKKGTLKRLLEGTHNFLNPNFKGNPYANKGYVVAKDNRTGDKVRVTKEDFDLYDYYVGVNIGKKHDEPHTNRGHNKGQTWKLKEKRNNIVTCPHCGKSGDASGQKRWHFDNCKKRNIE
jgi:hypothetical protein